MGFDSSRGPSPVLARTRNISKNEHTQTKRTFSILKVVVVVVVVAFLADKQQKEVWSSRLQKWLHERFGVYLEDFRFQPEESTVEAEEPLSAKRWAVMEKRNVGVGQTSHPHPPIPPPVAACTVKQHGGAFLHPPPPISPSCVKNE